LLLWPTFPAYRAVCKLGGKDSAHPADLWELLWQLAPVPAPLPARCRYRPTGVAPSTRALLDQQVLAVVKNADAPAAARLRDLCLGLAQTCAAPADTAFWQAAAGCFDATAHGLLEQDLYTKRLASRVLMHYASVAKAGDSAFCPPPDTLVRDLLYYCAQAADTAAMVMDGLPPVLQAICHSCQLLPADAPARVAGCHAPGDTTLTLDLGRGAEALAIPPRCCAAARSTGRARSTTPAAGPSATSDDAGLNLSHLVFGDEPEAPEVPVEVAEPSAPPAARAPIPQPVAQTTGDLSSPPGLGCHQRSAQCCSARHRRRRRSDGHFGGTAQCDRPGQHSGPCGGSIFRSTPRSRAKRDRLRGGRVCSEHASGSRASH
jgi:hypothetical protein